MLFRCKCVQIIDAIYEIPNTSLMSHSLTYIHNLSKTNTLIQRGLISVNRPFCQRFRVELLR